jgi:hypothetical protein
MLNFRQGCHTGGEHDRLSRPCTCLKKVIPHQFIRSNLVEIHKRQQFPDGL